MDIINLKEEKFDTEELEKQCSSLNLIFKSDNVVKHINLQKKCGEIYLLEKDVFSFLCTFCETPFQEIQNFYMHIKCDHEETCINIESDPLETHGNNDLFGVKVESRVKSRDEQPRCEKSNHSENKTFNKELNGTNNDLNVLAETKIITTQKLTVDKSDIEIQNELEIKRKLINQEKNAVLCKVCNKKFNSKRTLQRHKKSEHPKKTTNSKVQYKIETNEKDKEKSAVNEKISSENDPLKCKYCGRRLADTSVLIEHERIHTGERPCQCQICGKQFRTRSCVWRHEKTHSNIRQFKCDKCNMAFKSRGGLLAHMLRHGEKKFGCTYCDKQFHSKAAKIEHERIHTGEKPYKCNFCGKCFQTRGYLNIHNRSHTGIRPYKCQYCDRCFATKPKLDNHVVIHTGERPFVCTTCNGTFPRKKALKSHEKIHLDYRGYVCKICGEAFKQYPTLHGHMKSHKRLLEKSGEVKS